MKISREIIINGQSQRVDYELTGVELERAFHEYQNQSDKAEVTARLKESGEYERWDEIPDEIISQMAEDFRTEMDTIADTMGDGRIPAMESVFKRHKEDLEEYKEKWKVYSVKVQQTKEHYYSVKAKTEEEAIDLLERYLEDGYTRAECDFEDEDAEYETLYVDETEYTDPENCDIKGDE